MKIFRYIFLLVCMNSASLLADENSSISFAPDSADECSVMGKMVPSDENSSISFTATSTDSKEIFQIVKSKIEKGLVGEIEAEITDLETGEVEKVRFYGFYDDNSSVSVLKANLDDDSAILWKNPVK